MIRQAWYLENLGVVISTQNFKTGEILITICNTLFEKFTETLPND